VTSNSKQIPAGAGDERMRLAALEEEMAGIKARINPFPRPIHTAAERRKLRDEDAEDLSAGQRERTRLAEIEAKAQAKLAEAQREADKAREAAYHHDISHNVDYGMRRDVRWAQLWAGRDPLVDSLITRCHDEAGSLEVRAVSVPTSLAEQERRIDALGGLLAGRPSSIYQDFINNEAQVARRGVALRDLAEEVRRWGLRGDYADASDLQRKFDEKYSKIPGVPPVAELAARHRSAMNKPHPPAAA
jgi:hypothetical protein